MKKAFWSSFPVTLLSIGILFAFKVYLAGLYGKAELGVFYTALDVVTLVMMAFIGFRATMTVEYAKSGESSMILNVLRLFIAVVTLLCCLLLVPWMRSHLGVKLDSLLLVGLFAAYGVYTYYTNQLAMYRLYAAMNHVSLVEPIALVGWFVVFYYIFDVRDDSSLALSSIFSLFSVAFFTARYIRGRYGAVSVAKIGFSHKERTFIGDSMMASAEFVFGMFIMYLAVYVLTAYHSHSELGDFQVVVKTVLMYCIVLFVFPIFRFFLPEVALFVKNGDRDSLSALNAWILKYAFFVTIGVWGIHYLFGQWLILMLFGEAYGHAYLALAWLLWILFFIIINTHQIGIIKAHGKFALSMSIRAAGSVAFIAAYAVLSLWRNDLLTVVLSLDAGYLCMSVISRIAVSKLST